MFHGVIILLGVLNLVLLGILVRHWNNLKGAGRVGLGSVALGREN